LNVKTLLADKAKLCEMQASKLFIVSDKYANGIMPRSRTLELLQ
jgi:hypothetical protein